jgi:hypothetical protein
MVERYSEILLEQEQVCLLGILVEAARKTPPQERHPFFLSETFGGSFLIHPSLPDRAGAYRGDIETLGREGLIAVSQSQDTLRFDVTPLGFKYYSFIKGQTALPTERICTYMRAYLEADSFITKYRMAFDKWSQAEKLLEKLLKLLASVE